MLIPLDELQAKYNLSVNGVLHVGAHYGEEAAMYRKLRYSPVFWVEADGESIPHLKRAVEKYGHTVINALVSDESKPITFHKANNGQSSSILEFGTHSKEHPDVVFTGESTMMATTIDDLMFTDAISQCNFMNLDIQGAELMALKGATDYLNGVDYIYTEVNKKELYKGCVLLPQLDQWLDRMGFARVEIEMTCHGWGDAFYVK